MIMIQKYFHSSTWACLSIKKRLMEVSQLLGWGEMFVQVWASGNIKVGKSAVGWGELVRERVAIRKLRVGKSMRAGLMVDSCII